MTGYQTYELMFGCKFSTVFDAWLGLAKHNDQNSQSMSAWVNAQHELILSVHRWTLKNIKQTAKKTVPHVIGNTLDIPRDNVVLLRGHPEGENKIQD